MKKVSISAVLTGFVLALPGVAGAAYPVYQNYQNPQNVIAYPAGYQQNTTYSRTTVNVPATNSRVMTVNSGVAAQPNRVTGALPKVGSTAVAAGRQYYQPADYDRLADSGLYVGLSAAYTASVMGSIKSDYASEEDAYVVPGAFAAADFDSDTVIPLHLSVGAASN